MDRYRVSRREPIVRFIFDALETCGARIIQAPNPTSAPFEFVIQKPDGEQLQLICYAFLANKYHGKGRPKDEHRFQVKYGSEFDRYHHLYLPSRGDQVTLMFGVHLEAGIFVACDPAMHEWTWFSRSVEFKSNYVEEAKRSGWIGWERDRSEVRRKKVMPRENLAVEVLLAFRPDQFLRYVAFERIASGLESGERLLLADKIQSVSSGLPHRIVHPIERELGLPAVEILDLINGAFRLKAAVRGSAAERHLQTYLSSFPGVTQVDRIDKDGWHDLDVVFHQRSLRVECKNVLRKPDSGGFPRVDFQKTRASKGNPCSRYYRPEQFDVLAACLHPITERWEYRFAPTSALPPHRTCKGHLSPSVIVEGSVWHDDLASLVRVL